MAALIFPLVFRRRAPMTVFLVIAAVALRAVARRRAGPGRRRAPRRALHGGPRVRVAPRGGGGRHPRSRRRDGDGALGADAATTCSPSSSSPASSSPPCWPGWWCGRLRSQLDWLAERAERLELERDQQASLAAVTERARIAREMHDVVSHNIQVMVTLADAASLAQASDPERAAEAIHEVSSTGRQALTDMRRMLGVLREEPVAGAPDGAGAGDPVNGDGNRSGRASLAPQPGLRELDALVERVRATGLDIAVEREGSPFELSGAAGLTVYRVVQEALTNALKHAHEPTSVEVRPGLRRSRRVGAGHRRRGNGDGNGTGDGTGNGNGTGPGTGTAAPRRRAAATGWPAWRSGPRPSAGPSAPGRDRRAAGRSRPCCATARRPHRHDHPGGAGRRPGAPAQGLPHDSGGRGGHGDRGRGAGRRRRRAARRALPARRRADGCAHAGARRD